MKANKFTRADIAKVMTDNGIDRGKSAGLALAIVQTMADALTAGKVIELRGLGTLALRERKARTMHDPRTMAAVEVPVRSVVFFKPSGKLKRAINGNIVGNMWANQKPKRLIPYPIRN
jgi:nucleoid DNA-binding protein